MSVANAFKLEGEAHEKGFDLAMMREEWLTLSEEKSWPATEEGWRRYIVRVIESGKGPKRPKEKARTIVMVPAGFEAWWRSHPHCGLESDGTFAPCIHAIWFCRRYREEWKEHEAARRKAA